MIPNGKIAKPLKKTKGMMAKFTDLIAWFLGSWWAVIAHTLWFSIWLAFNVRNHAHNHAINQGAMFK